MKFVIAFLAVVLMGVGICAVSYVSAHNRGNVFEKGIVAAWDHNRNVLSNYTSKVQEAAQIPAMQRDDLTKVVEAALSARYGEDGSKAMFQFIKEQNPTIDSTVYVKLQQIIEAGRTDFQVAQDQLVDKRRAYLTELDYFWSGMWMRVAGLPKIDISKYDIVVLGSTQKIFDSGVDETLKLR